MSKLHDPDLSPGAIVKEYDDGGALRNDGVRLKPANQNPWYVLATLHGEQPADAHPHYFDFTLADRNREAWNRWAQDALDDAEKAELLRRFRARLGDNSAELPDPSKTYDFSNTHFSGFTCFAGYALEKTPFFHKVTFSAGTSFNGATISNGIHFIDVAFCGSTFFAKVTFGEFAYFVGVSFSEVVLFNSATFKGTTIFDHARFLSHVPEFHAAELYEDTVFPIPKTPTANWPPQSGEDVMPADNQKRAYSRLRLFFAKSQQIDEEQFFHRQEMRCKRVTAGWATKGMYSIYSALSDYGISIWRPLAYLILLTVLGGDLLGAHRQALGEGQDWAMLGENMGWSLANLVPFTGFGRTFFGPDFYQGLPGWLQAFAGAQTLAAIPLLFLLGLGLRNTFRLR